MPTSRQVLHYSGMARKDAVVPGRGCRRRDLQDHGGQRRVGGRGVMLRLNNTNYTFITGSFHIWGSLKTPFWETLKLYISL